jgi:hypothetical protein
MIFAGRRLINTGQNLHQGGFSGAVLSQDDVNFPRIDVQVNAL